jgi:hypothetical protein
MTLLSIYEIGNFIGTWGCILYGITMVIATIWVMRKYLK